MKHIKLFEEFNNINEGQFGWITIDGVQTASWKPVNIYMYDNQGNEWEESNYEGYGKFGDEDYFDVLARMNGYTEEDVKGEDKLRSLRIIGINIAHDEIKTKAPEGKVLFPALFHNPRIFDLKTYDFTQEPDQDPNQSWEPDRDESDDDYEYEY